MIDILFESVRFAVVGSVGATIAITIYRLLGGH